MSSGWNPVTGRDATGSLPPYAPYGTPMPGPGQPYIHHSGGPGSGFGGPPRWANVPNPAAYPPQGPAAGFHAQPNGAGNVFARVPQPWPRIDPSMPAVQMSNSTGGVGCEPGYNYFFAPEHTKAHIFKTNIPPWQLPAGATLNFTAAHIPCNTTLADLLKGFGCTNPSAKKNRVFEITSGGGGKWYRGLEIGGGDKESMKKTIGEIGWDGSRTGNPGEKPVVCLWFCKD